MTIYSKILFSGLFLVPTLGWSFAGPKGSKIYPLKGDSTEVLYTMKRSESSDGKIQAQFFDKSGTMLIEEKTSLVNGQFQSYEIDNKQLGTKGKIEKIDSKVHFTYGEPSHEKQSKESYEDNFIIAVTTVPFLHNHWEALVNGKTLKVRYGVADRRETVGFEFKNVGEEEINGKKLMKVKMKPSSFIIAALVNPLHFYFDPETKNLMELHGRVLPKVKDGSKWKDLDARQVYEY